MRSNPHFFFYFEVIMAATIAPSTFHTGPKDTVAVKDVYQETEYTPASGGFVEKFKNITKATEDVSSSLTKNLELAKGAGNQILSIKSLKDLKDKQTRSSLKDLMANAGNLTKIEGLDTLKGLLPPGVVKALGEGDVTKQLLKGVGFVAEDNALIKGAMGLKGKVDGIQNAIKSNEKIQVLYGTTKKLQSIKDLKKSGDIVAVLNSVLGDSQLGKVLHLEGTFKLLGNALDWASYFNIPNIVDDVMGAIKDKKDKKKFALANAANACRGGNLDIIEKIMDITGAGAFLARCPNAVMLILMNFKEPTGVTPARAQKLIDILNRLDGNWLRYNRNGVWISNLDPLTYASKDSYKAISIVGSYSVELMIAKSYPSTNLPGLAKRNYPKAVT